MCSAATCPVPGVAAAPSNEDEWLHVQVEKKTCLLPPLTFPLTFNLHFHAWIFAGPPWISSPDLIYIMIVFEH